jgi:hypothetical protein
MGLACPVCDLPQRDAEHLANHLAFTAMLHGDDHEAWLEAHAPDWRAATPATLAEEVAPHAESATYDEVFEDTAHDPGRPFAGEMGGGHHQHGHGHGHGHDHQHGRPGDSDGVTDERTREVLAEAREMTRQMRAETDGDATDADENA